MILVNKDFSETTLAPAKGLDKNSSLWFDTDGDCVKKVQEFWAENWEEAKVVYEKYLKKAIK